MRRFQTLYEIFSELNRVGSGTSSTPERGPVLLLLGGGMAAGKSTVREVIGHDDFWSKARSWHACIMQARKWLHKPPHPCTHCRSLIVSMLKPAMAHCTRCRSCQVGARCRVFMLCHFKMQHVKRGTCEPRYEHAHTVCITHDEYP